jgi:hypothetical protein
MQSLSLVSLVLKFRLRLHEPSANFPSIIQLIIERVTVQMRLLRIYFEITSSNASMKCTVTLIMNFGKSVRTPSLMSLSSCN